MLNRVSLLFSMAFMQSSPFFFDVAVQISKYADVLIDSGAHSNYGLDIAALNNKPQSRKKVELDGYIKACKRFHGRVWEYIMLDKVKDPETSNLNLEKMLDAGLVPMPVMVIGDPVKRAVRLMKINKRVAVAGGVNSGMTHIHRRFQDIYNATDGEIGIHALGYGRYPETLTLPIISSDSSSWCSGGQYGTLSRYYKKTGFSKISWRELSTDKVSKARKMKWLDHLVNDLGMRPDQIKDLDYYSGVIGIPSTTTVFSYIYFAQHCYENGVRFFLAVPNVNWLRVYLSVLNGMTDITKKKLDYKVVRQTGDILGSLAHDQQIEMFCKILKEKTIWDTELP